MKGFMKKGSVFIFFVLATILAGSVPSSAKVIPKVTNFIVLVDQSGSMFEKHATQGKTKASLVKSVLFKMNESIPPLGYNAAVQVFSPDRTLMGPERYNRLFFANAIQTLQEAAKSIDPDQLTPDTRKMVEQMTPLGPSILYLDKIMKNFGGKTAVILVSDGRANQGMDPLKAARQIRNEYTNICFHVISVADTEKGRETLKAITALCDGAYSRASDLFSDASLMDYFVNEVFFLDVEDRPAPLVKVTPEALTLQGALFDFDKHNIKPEYTAMLDQDVDKLLENPNTKINIEGHTDSTGPEAYNQRLSERRAKAVYNYLLSRGVSADRMKTVGYGETRAKVSNLTREGQALNRRVELLVVR